MAVWGPKEHTLLIDKIRDRPRWLEKKSKLSGHMTHPGKLGLQVGVSLLTLSLLWLDCL